MIRVIEIGIDVMHNFNAYFYDFFLFSCQTHSCPHPILIKEIYLLKLSKKVYIYFMVKRNTTHTKISRYVYQDFEVSGVLLFSNMSKIYDCFIFCYLYRLSHLWNCLNTSWDILLLIIIIFWTWYVIICEYWGLKFQIMGIVLFYKNIKNGLFTSNYVVTTLITYDKNVCFILSSMFALMNVWPEQSKPKCGCFCSQHYQHVMIRIFQTLHILYWHGPWMGYWLLGESYHNWELILVFSLQNWYWITFYDLYTTYIMNWRAIKNTLQVIFVSMFEFNIKMVIIKIILQSFSVNHTKSFL